MASLFNPFWVVAIGFQIRRHPVVASGYSRVSPSGKIGGFPSRLAPAPNLRAHVGLCLLTQSELGISKLIATENLTAPAKIGYYSNSRKQC